MSDDINVSGVEINIKGTKHTLSVDECKRLRDALNGLLEKQTVYVDRYPIRRWPWWECDDTGGYPSITYKINGTDGTAGAGISVGGVTV